MENIKRCSECIRPVCQRQLTLNGCKQKNDEDINKETIELFSINSYEMHDLYLG